MRQLFPNTSGVRICGVEVGYKTWSGRPGQSSMPLPVKIASCFGVLECCKISNSKHQITNKSQIPIFNDQNKKQVWNFEFWSLLFVCYLRFVIWNF